MLVKCTKLQASFSLFQFCFVMLFFFVVVCLFFAEIIIANFFNLFVLRKLL